MTKRKKRSQVRSNANRLRLSVFKSNIHIYAQLIDDSLGKTIASASSLKMKSEKGFGMAAEVGKLIAQAAKKQKVDSIVFDRGNYIYSGKIKVLADAARSEGLKF